MPWRNKSVCFVFTGTLAAYFFYKRSEGWPRGALFSNGNLLGPYSQNFIKHVLTIAIKLSRKKSDYFF